MTTRFHFESMGIGRLLKQGSMIVPPNQRSYAWEERHVRDILQDINEALLKNDDDYFLGTVVLIQKGRETPLIADGQQRLVTVTIILARIRDLLEKLSKTRSAQAVDNEYIREIDIQSEEIEPRIKLNIEDNTFFRNSILPTFEPVADRSINMPRPSNRRLRSASKVAAEFLSDAIKNLPPTGRPDHLLRWIRYIESNATIVVVTVPDDVGAFRIFETLNDRGLRASQADILKNYFFSKVGSRLSEAQMMWNTISSALETLGDEDGDRLVTYIRHLWVMTHGPTKERELAAQIKNEINGEGRTMDFLAAASEDVFDYIALWSSHHPKWANHSSTTKECIDVMAKVLRVEQIRPLMFAVAKKFEGVELEKAFKLFVGWSVRFLIYGGRGGMLDTQYSLRAKDVGTGRFLTARDLREAMRTYVPKDSEFQEAFATARVSRPNIARYYLRAIETTMRNSAGRELVANDDVQEVNLEHVLPLNPSGAWEISSDETEAAQKLIGNMVLMRNSANTSIGNLGFFDKKRELAASAFLTTRQVAEYPSWGLQQIRDRQLKLSELAAETWSLRFGD